MSINIIIIAAGQGTRMNSKIPKVMHLISERPALGYIIESAAAVAPKQLILVTAPWMDDVRKFADIEHAGIIHAIQEQPMGTADAVKAALPHIDKTNGQTIILYGDSPFITYESLNIIKNKVKDLLLVGFHTNEPNKYGRLITYDNELLEIVEFNDSNDDQKLLTHCNSGIIAIKNAYLYKLIPLIKNRNFKREFYLTDIVKIANQHDISCKIFDVEENEVVGINTREDLSKAESIMQVRIKKKLMNQGVTIINPESSYIAYDFKAGTDVTIYPNVFIGSKVRVGNNVVIRSFSHLEGLVSEDNVVIGPFSRVRPLTHLGANVKVGNFVEIKNSKIEHSSKISHLSYVGDATIGYEVNIGAGAITCNFDGIKKKSRTNIGNQVSIGSNTCLIAPVTIDDGAFIAAGSVINKDVEKDTLAFARAKQVNLSKKAKSLRKNSE